MVNALVREFPNLTVIDVAAIVRQLQSVLDQVITAVEFLFAFTLAAGLATSPYDPERWLAEHAYRLSQAFSKFYAACPILPAEPPVRTSRLGLAQVTLRQLELALDLLGVAAPERM